MTREEEQKVWCHNEIIPAMMVSHCVCCYSGNSITVGWYHISDCVIVNCIMWTLSPAYILTVSSRFTVAAARIHRSPAENYTSNQKSTYIFPQAICE